MQNHVVIALFPHTVLHYTCSQISETVFTWRTESVLAIVKFCRYSLRGSMTMHKLMLWLSNIHSLNQLTQRSTALCCLSQKATVRTHCLKQHDWLIIFQVHSEDMVDSTFAILEFPIEIDPSALSLYWRLLVQSWKFSSVLQWLEERSI